MPPLDTQWGRGNTASKIATMTLAELVAGENLVDNHHEPERLSKHFLCGLRSQPSKQDLHESLELEQTTLGQAMARLTMLVNQEDHVNSYSNPIKHGGMCTMSSPSPVSSKRSVKQRRRNRNLCLNINSDQISF